MKDYKYYLDATGEIGYVQEIVHSVAYMTGLPSARVYEVIIFEDGELGMVLSLTRKHAEVLLLSTLRVRVGAKAARTGETLKVPVGEGLFGQTMSPLGLEPSVATRGTAEMRELFIEPMGILGRTEVKKPFETGVKMVDLVVPLGQGQRELVIGDRKTGKSQFLMQTMLSQARQGTVCIYAGIAKKGRDIRNLNEFIRQSDISSNTVIVVSGAADPAGLIYLTPYTAMTIAEYFRDQGKNTLLILDNLTTHASYYREITLLARRFPGRSSYPGDIFYIHSRLLERAGSFEKASITALPVAESIMGDISGYIQTNLMAMTDGHIYFDIDRYNRGARPSINPFLSVTRVGLSAHTPLVRDLNRQVSSFLVHYETLRDFMHFGAEVSESLKKTLDLGRRIEEFFSQPVLDIVPQNASIFILAAVWGGYGIGFSPEQLKTGYDKLFARYKTDADFKSLVDSYVTGSPVFLDLVTKTKQMKGELDK